MIANFKILKLLKFIDYIGLKDLKFFSHRSAGSQREMLLTISDTLKNALIEKLQSVNFYWLMIDDLSDVSSLEQIVVYMYIQYMYINPDIGTVQTYFLFIANLLEKSTLFNVLCENFETMKLNLKKISGLCTDGTREITNEKDIEGLLYI